MSETITYKGIEKLQSFNSIQEINDSILSLIPVSKKDIETTGVYVFGVGKLGQRIFDFLSLKGIKIHGFIDNNTDRQKEKFNNLTVFSINTINKDALVYIASAMYFNPIYKQLLGLGFTKIFSHLQAGILFLNETTFPVEMYQEKLTEDLFTNKDKYLQVFDLLEEDESKRVFDSLMSFRSTLNQKHIDTVYTKTEKEYFDGSVIKLSDSEVYIDGGGFDGDTAESFINFVKKKYKSVHVFEPDTALLNKAKVRLKEFDHIAYNPLGIYDKKTTLYFDITGGLDGIISNQGSVKIDTISIDEYKDAQPTYIKLDIEGVEIQAINGAVNTIKTLKPKLAIASYHYPKHLWEIPLLIKSINPAYKLKLRHYTDSVFESVFYFI
jgi:FkbM family methyltransferase